MLTRVACLGIISCGSPWIAHSHAQVFPKQLRLVAQVDGVDDLHVGPASARLVHHDFDVPKSVSINGRAWNPSITEHWKLEDGDRFWDPNIDLAGAQVSLIRGRGTIDFHHDAQGLVLHFDDSLAGGSDEYEVLIDFAEVICAEEKAIGLTDAEIAAAAMEYPKELIIHASVDGRDELHLGPVQADWLHLDWDWPKHVAVQGQGWSPLEAPLFARNGQGYFHPAADLERALLKVTKARGKVLLRQGRGRLFIEFDDGPHSGADEYEVRLIMPKTPRKVPTQFPVGKPLCVELMYPEPSDVLGAKVRTLVLSPATKEFIPLPGLRGMDGSGRCMLALAPGTYRFEVLHLTAAKRVIALRTGPMRILKKRSITLPSHPAAPLHWKRGKERIQPAAFAIHSMMGDGAVRWTRESEGEELWIVASPKEAFSLSAFGSLNADHFAWWTEHPFEEDAELDCTRQLWVQSRFKGHERDPLPTDSYGELRGPASQFEFPIEAKTRLFTNRRFVSLSYGFALEDGGSAVFHPRWYALPKLGRRHSFTLGGPLTWSGSAQVLLNERLGSADTKQLWWVLEGRDSAGHVLNTAASAINWQAKAVMVDGGEVPSAPLDEEGLALLSDPTKSVSLQARLNWDGPQEIKVEPSQALLRENSVIRTVVPGHLEQRAQAYVHKAQRTYRELNAAIGRTESYTTPITIKWWMNGGAVGVHGSITMPIQGMQNDFDWFQLPWALAHESLHGFGYHHGPELDRLDKLVIESFERERWNAERDPGWIPGD